MQNENKALFSQPGYKRLAKAKFGAKISKINCLGVIISAFLIVFRCLSQIRRNEIVFVSFIVPSLLEFVEGKVTSSSCTS